MKLLKVENKLGLYRDPQGGYAPIDRITKEHLLALVDATLNEPDVELDEYSEAGIANQAHQIVYKNVFQKLQDLRNRKEEFLDQSQRLYLQEYARYRADTQQEAP